MFSKYAMTHVSDQSRLTMKKQMHQTTEWMHQPAEDGYDAQVYNSFYAFYVKPEVKVSTKQKNENFEWQYKIKETWQGSGTLKHPLNSPNLARLTFIF